MDKLAAHEKRITVLEEALVLSVQTLASHDDQLAGVYPSLDQLILAEAMRSSKTGEDAQEALLVGPDKLPRSTPAGFKPIVSGKAIKDALSREESDLIAATRRIIRMQALSKLSALVIAIETEKVAKLEAKLRARADYDALTDRLAGVRGSK